MKKLYIAIMTAAVLAAGASAQPAPATGADTAARQQQAVRPSTPQQQQLNKQASVNRPTKRTNWSKIKTLFE